MEWELSPGDTVDGWTLIQSLGGGGNGEVWAAEHPILGRAALKLLKLKFQDQDHKRYLRFRDEAKMHKQLAAKYRGVLPFVGCSLPENPAREAPAWLATQVAIKAQSALEDKPLREAVEAVGSVADTLAAVHEDDVCHRDIKPDNLFQCEGRWAVGDFGLVDYPDKESLTDTGERLGPFHYLAPEMYNAANRSDGRKADVYSLGKTLWVLTTGQRVPPPGELRADNAQLGIRVYTIDSRAHQLDFLIERATRHDPVLRPTMAEFANELQAWLNPPSRPASPLDLSDLAAKLTTLTAPARREQDVQKERYELVRRLGNRLEGEMATLREALVSALDPSVASVALLPNNGNVQTALPKDETVSADRFTHNDLRTLCASMHSPAWCSMYSGFGLQLSESGWLRVFGGHVVRKSDGPHELVWSVVRVVWPESAEMEHAFREVISGLNENLRLAVERLVGFLEFEASPAPPASCRF